MAWSTSGTYAAEYLQVRAQAATEPDLELRAIQVAIYLEDALDIRLPEAALDWSRLGSLAEVDEVLASLEDHG